MEGESGRVSDTEAFRESVVRAYGSLTTPNWAFVNDAVSRDPYGELARELVGFGDVADDTDVNYDVSFTYIVRRPRRPIVVRLSMVGPYALVLAVADDLDAPTTVIATADDTGSLGERAVVEFLAHKGFTLLDRETLERPIRFTIDDAQVVPLHRVLFSSEGLTLSE
jgi:hypothetical protein